MASTKTTVFVTGVTGYIGGAVLSAYLERSDASKFTFNALTRDAKKGEKLKSSFGINPVVGSLSDLELIEDHCANADFVLSMADADDLGSVKAMLRGMKRRHESSGKAPIFIHTSGTGVLSDDAHGRWATDTIYNDADPKQMATLDSKQPHREVDIEIVAADSQGYVSSYIVLPSTIWGIAQNSFVKSGISNHISQQVPMQAKAGLKRGQGGMFGEGKNIWNNVCIEELGHLYTTLYDAAVNGKGGHGSDGYYFGENGEHKLYDVCTEIAKALVKLGKGKSETPTTYTDDEIKKYFGPGVLEGSYDGFGSNSRSGANHSKSIGWKPSKTTEDFLASIKYDVEDVVGGA